MDTLNILGIDYNIDTNFEKNEVRFYNSDTGIDRIYRLHSLYIEPNNKIINTKWHSFDVTPNGQEINRKTTEYTNNEIDYNEFEQSAIGVMVKKMCINGVFRFVIGNTIRVFDSNGGLVTVQPVTG